MEKDEYKNIIKRLDQIPQSKIEKMDSIRLVKDNYIFRKLQENIGQEIKKVNDALPNTTVTHTTKLTARMKKDKQESTLTIRNVLFIELTDGAKFELVSKGHKGLAISGFELPVEKQKELQDVLFELLIIILHQSLLMVPELHLQISQFRTDVLEQVMFYEKFGFRVKKDTEHIRMVRQQEYLIPSAY
jgi:hypothetical protein